MSIRFEQVTKRYNGIPVVNDVTLEVHKGEFFVLLGPSGSGKSTLLRGVAGLTAIDHGRIALHGRDVTFMRPRERGVGFVFQHYALFRNMSIADNIEFALRIRGVPAARRRARRRELLKLVALEGLDERLPSQLSGGQQQRVAVARALAHEPEVLLLDEPFGALDAKIRLELRRTVREVQQRLGTTTILVTHDQEEAFLLADRIGVMHMGRLLETGRPEQLYREPITRFVATFLGDANLLLGEVVGPRVRIGQAVMYQAGLARAGTPSGSEVVTVVRPEDLALSRRREALEGDCLAEGIIRSINFGGSGEHVVVEVDPATGLRPAARPDPLLHPQAGAESCLLEVSRTAAEATAMPLVADVPVVIGVRRVHVLPTPVSSFLLRAGSAEAVAALRTVPLVVQLLRSTRAQVHEAVVDGELAVAFQRSAGMVVMEAEERTAADLATILGGGVRRLLCVPRQALPPRQMIIYCPDHALQVEAMALVASLVRNIKAEAVFVSQLRSQATATERAKALRYLLDTRAEVRARHDLDLRTRLLEEEISGQLEALVKAADPALLVLGLGGGRSSVEELLGHRLGWLFESGLSVPLLLAHSGRSPLPAASLPQDW